MAWQRDPNVLTPALHPLLEQRWSPRAFASDHELAPEDLATILEAARWSPSGGNTQPWAFIAGFRGDETHGKIVETLSRGNQPWVPLASAVILTVRQVESGPDRELPMTAYTAYDLGQSVAHLSIQAQAMGLHVHQFAGFDHAAAQEAFGIPAHWAVTTGVAIGKLADPSVLDERTREKELLPRSRRPLSEFVFAGSWGATAEAVTGAAER